MDRASVRVLVVDDNEPWRRFFSSVLQKQPELEVIGWASDGLAAVQQAEQLQPHLILLDIGLPMLNGIAAARRIREIAPASRILFVSENRSPEIAKEALSTGACGYVAKSDAGNELLSGINAVLKSKRFVSASLALQNFVELADDQSPNSKSVVPFTGRKKIRHEVEFYDDDAGFVDGFARFIEVALRAGSAVIVAATESHQAELLQRLIADGLNMPAAIEEGRYIRLDAADTLSRFIANGSLDPVLFNKLAVNLITNAAKGAKREHRRVAACGEGVHVLLASGNVDATLTLESMWNEIAKRYEVDILCGYFRSAFARDESVSTLERVCAEHSAVHGRELCC